LKTHQILLYVDFLSQGPVTGQTGAVYCSNRSVNCQKPVAREIWFENLNLSDFFGNRSNRSGKPLPEASGFTLVVRKKT
jgi:hypothetical protein